jgi:GntR family transcriptional repressor for pyruvate dehydrogenase complex
LVNRLGNRADGPSAASSVAEELTALVLGELAPGSSLPSEGALALRYGVSRLTVREAIKMLAGRGLLDLSRGRRALVREPDGSAFGDFLKSIVKYDGKGIFDLVEVRLSLEVQSATLAARRASRAGLAAVENALQGMRDAAAAVHRDDPDSELHFHRYDIGFHEALALASGNRVLSFLFEAMAAPLQDSFFISRSGHLLRGHTIEDTIAAHERIMQAIAEGNERAAGEAMRAHLEDTERDIRAAVSNIGHPPKS